MRLVTVLEHSSAIGSVSGCSRLQSNTAGLAQQRRPIQVKNEQVAVAELQRPRRPKRIAEPVKTKKVT